MWDRFLSYLIAGFCSITTATSFSDSSMWQARTTNMAQLVSYLKASGAVTDGLVAETMMKVDRGIFCDQGKETEISGGPYADNPLPLECGQTISAPHIHAMSLEVLKEQVLTPSARVLDVGSGSGYVSACFAIMNPSARVFGIEVHKDLVKSSITKAAKLPGGAPKNLVIQQADGWEGLLHEGPFHAINVGAAAVSIPAPTFVPVEITKPLFAWMYVAVG